MISLLPTPIPKNWGFRHNTFDYDIWNAIVNMDEYAVPKRFNHDDVIMDIGCHIGTFTYLAWTRGCRQLFAYEMDHDNYKFAIHNLEPYGARITHCAVVGSDQQPGKVAYKENNNNAEWEMNLKNTGGYYLSPDGDKTVDSLPFDFLVDKALEYSANGRIKMLKIDCEGSEWPILLTSKRLDCFDSIVGEYHIWGLGEGRNTKEIADVLFDHGFIVQVVGHRLLPGQGHFFAYQKPSMSEYATHVVSFNSSHHFLWRNHGHALGNDLLATKNW